MGLTWRPTLKEARKGVQATLNMGRTWSECVADWKPSRTCDTDSMSWRAVDDSASISMYQSSRRCFSLATATEGKKKRRRHVRKRQRENRRMVPDGLLALLVVEWAFILISLPAISS